MQTEYSDACATLASLGMSKTDQATLLTLRSSNISELKKEAINRQSLGEGWVQLPWYWCVNLENDESLSSLEQIHKEYTESLRVQWFRARACFERWQEEVYWLQHEAASMVLDFQHRSHTWAEHSKASSNAGWWCYSSRQADLWSSLSKDAYTRLTQPICDRKATPLTKPICQRVSELLSHL
ncbi:unnamed protein product [Rhizoctonia solani]|uniref:Uncharacterized protein n=1 Tax=Rhizoctonia solani TaxID=456999 RepID=A0A8H3DGT4_9AGAM|nr:unnamed protein product [Rhizoctonia solani]